MGGPTLRNERSPAPDPDARHARRGPSVTAGLPRDFTKVVFGELPSLVHDADFINAIHNRCFHGAILDGLKTWFT